MSVRSETLGEVIEWLGNEADREWERAKDGLSDGYGGFDAYTRAIQHCQDMIVEDEASSGKHTEIALLKHLADTFDERLHKAERAKDRGAGYTYNDDLPTKNMKCYVTDKDKRKRLVEIRVSKDGTKLGLYDTDGKALKQTGRE